MGWELTHSVWVAGPVVEVQSLKRAFDVFWGLEGTPYAEGPRYAYECVGSVDPTPFLSLVRADREATNSASPEKDNSTVTRDRFRGVSGVPTLLEICCREVGSHCSPGTVTSLERLPHELFELCIVHAPPAALADYWVGDATENAIRMTGRFKDQLLAGCEDIAEGQLWGALQYHAVRIRKWDFIEEGYIGELANQFPSLTIVCQTEDHDWMPKRMVCHGPDFPEGGYTVYDISRESIVGHSQYKSTWGVTCTAVEENGWRMWRHSEDSEDEDDTGVNKKHLANWSSLDKMVHLG